MNPTAVRPVRDVRHRAVSQAPVRVAKAVKRAKGVNAARAIANVIQLIVLSAPFISATQIVATAIAQIAAATMEDHKEETIMIIKGNVLTNEGPKAIEEIKEGDIVINLGNRPCRVVKVEKGDCTEVIRFQNNPDLLVSRDSSLATRYGMLDGGAAAPHAKEEMLYQCEAPCFFDTLEPGTLETPLPGYELTLDSGKGVFVNGYGIGCKEGANA